MSVKELILKDQIGNSITVNTCANDGFIFSVKDLNRVTNFYLKREHAHLLKLYLEEHLK